MKKLLAMLLTLALLCATGIAMAAEAVLPDTIPTITVDISADGNVTLKTSDGKTDYNSVYVYVKDADGNSNSIWLEYNESAGAYVSQESYQGEAAGKTLSNAYVEKSESMNTGYSSISFYYNENSEISSADAYNSKDEYNEDGIRTSYEYSSQRRNYSDGVIDSEYTNSQKTFYDSDGNATSEESESSDKYYSNETLTQESKDSRKSTYSGNTRISTGTSETKNYDSETGEYTGKSTNEYTEKTNKDTWETISYTREYVHYNGNDVITSKNTESKAEGSNTEVSDSESYSENGVKTSESHRERTTVVGETNRTEKNKSEQKSYDSETGAYTGRSSSENEYVYTIEEGRRVSSSYKNEYYNANDELTDKSSSIYEYDENGNTKSYQSESAYSYYNENGIKYQENNSKSIGKYNNGTRESVESTYENKYYDEKTGEYTGKTVGEEKTSYNPDNGSETISENKSTSYNSKGEVTGTSDWNRVYNEEGTQYTQTEKSNGSVTINGTDLPSYQNESKSVAALVEREDYSTWITVSEEYDRTNFSYNDNGIKTSESHSVGTTKTDNETRTEKSKTERKNYDYDTGMYSGRSVSESEYIYPENSWNYTSYTSSEESYNATDVLTRTSTNKGERTLDENGNTKEEKSEDAYAYYNEKGVKTSEDSYKRSTKYLTDTREQEYISEYKWYDSETGAYAGKQISESKTIYDNNYNELTYTSSSKNYNSSDELSYTSTTDRERTYNKDKTQYTSTTVENRYNYVDGTEVPSYKSTSTSENAYSRNTGWSETSSSRETTNYYNNGVISSTSKTSSKDGVNKEERKEYNDSGSLTSEYTSEASVATKDNVRTSKGQSEQKYYDYTTGAYRSKSVSTYEEKYDTKKYQTISRTESTKNYNSEDVLTSERTSNSALTYSEDEKTRTSTSNSETISYSSLGKKTGTEKSSSTQVENYVEKIGKNSDGSTYKYHTWETETRENLNERYNKNDILTYSSKSTVKGDTQTTETKNYSDKGVLSSESMSVTSTVTAEDGKTQTEKGNTETKRYNPNTKKYTGKTVSEYNRERETSTWLVLKGTSSNKQYNENDVLISSDVNEDTTTYSEDKKTRTIKSTGEVVSNNEYGVLIATQKSESIRVDKKTEEGSWEYSVETSSSRIRTNKDGEIVYSNISSSKDGVSKGETKAFNEFGVQTGGSKYEYTDTKRHSETSNRYGLASTSDYTYDKDGYLISSENKAYENYRNGKNVLSYSYINKPTYEKNEYESKIQLNHTASVNYDKYGAETSTTTRDETYNAKDNTVTQTTVTVNYVGKAVDAEMHDKVESIRITSRDAEKNYDWSDITTTYDWDGTVEYKSVSSQVSVKNEKAGNFTVTTTYANYSDDGITMLNGSVTTVGTDENGNSYTSEKGAEQEYTWESYRGYDKDGYSYSTGKTEFASGQTIENENRYDKNAKKYVSTDTYYMDSKKVGVETQSDDYDADQNYIGWTRTYKDATGKLVMNVQSRRNEATQAFDITYTDGAGKEIGYEKTDKDGMKSEKIPELSTDDFTVTGGYSETTRKAAKAKDKSGATVNYVISTSKYVNAEDIVTYESKNDAYGDSYEKRYDSENGKITWSTEQDAKGNRTERYYGNPGQALSRVESYPAAVTNDKGQVTSQINSDVSYYDLDGTLDRRTVNTTAYEYDKTGMVVKTTNTIEYKNSANKTVVTRTSVQDVKDKNNWKEQYTTTDGTVIGYTTYSGYVTEEYESERYVQVGVDEYGYAKYAWEPYVGYYYGGNGTRESLTPNFNAYTGKVYSTTLSKSTQKEDGSYTSSTEEKNKDGELNYATSYTRDVDGNTVRTRSEYYNEDNHLSYQYTNNYDAETKKTTSTGTRYRYSGSVLSSWESESGYDKDQDLSIDTQKNYNSKGELVYIREAKTQAKAYGTYGTSNYVYYGDVGYVANIQNVIYTDAEGKEIGYATYAADGGYSDKIPGTTSSGNLSGAWTETTRSADSKVTSSKSYDKNGLLTSESSKDENTTTSKTYWTGTNVVKTSTTAATDNTGITKTITVSNNEDGTLRARTETDSGRKSGTHFITETEKHYNNNGQLVYTYEYVNDLRKDTTTGVYKDANGKEIGHDRIENEDGSWSRLVPKTEYRWNDQTGEEEYVSLTKRTGELLGFVEMGEDKDGHDYTIEYDKNMKVTSKSGAKATEEGYTIWEYDNNGDGIIDSVWDTAKETDIYYNNKGEVIRSYEYENYNNGIADGGTFYYNNEGKLVYTAFHQVDRGEYRYDADTIYVDANGKEIGYEYTNDDGYWTYKRPQTTYANNITGYHEYTDMKDGYISRDYDAENKLIGSNTYKYTHEITDDYEKTTTTDGNGKVTSVRTDYYDVDEQITKSETKSYSRWNGALTSQFKTYYDEDSPYTYRKSMDENGNVTWYGATWNYNDWNYVQDYWVNGQLQDYSKSDNLNEQGSHREYYNPDGSYNSWTEDDGQGNRKYWYYGTDGILDLYEETSNGVTNTTYYDRNGNVSGYEMNRTDNGEYWIDGQDSQIWNASQIMYNVHTESDPNADGMLTTWTDPAGNVKVMSEAGTTVTLKNTADGWQSAFGDEWYYLEGGKPATGWKQIGGTWYYFYEDGSMATGLVKEDNTTYTLGEDGTWTMAGWNEDAYGNWSYADGAGHALTGWQYIGGQWYYFTNGWNVNEYGYDEDIGWYEYTGGTMVTGAYDVWNDDWSGKTTYFFNSDGSWDTSAGWKSDGVDWYYFDANGSRATGWRQIDGTWYYFNAKGVMRNGWVDDGGTYYYMNESGSMAAGQWVQERYEDDWYYMKGDGSMATGWQQIGGSWYYMDADGVMETGWQTIGDTSYYLQEDGAMATGWQQVDGSWYYMNSDGTMVTGWQQIGGTWYYFYSNGTMATGDVTIDGQVNHFGSNGAWLGAD